MTKTTDNIQKECLRIEEDTLHSGKSHYNAASLWSSVHYLIGVPATVFAAWAGINAFGNDPSLSGYLALIAAALTALQTFLGASDKASQHKSVAGGYLAIRNQTRIFREVEVSLMDQGEAVKNLCGHAQSRDELNNMAPSIPFLAFCMTKKGIDKGEADYKADKGERE